MMAWVQYRENGSCLGALGKKEGQRQAILYVYDKAHDVRSFYMYLKERLYIHIVVKFEQSGRCKVRSSCQWKWLQDVSQDVCDP